MTATLAKPDEIWVFDVCVPIEGGTMTALAVAIGRRLPAARLALQKHLAGLGVTAADSTSRGTFADLPLDDVRALAEGLGQGEALLGPFGHDVPHAFAQRTDGFLIDRLADTDAVRATLFPSTSASKPDQWSLGTSTYALLDGARVFGLAEMLEGSGLAFASLFIGQAAVDYAETAPYLVRLRAEHALTDRLLTAGSTEDPLGWDAGPGLLIRSPLSLAGLQRQLRGFTFVYSAAQNKRLYFRFYDPRIFAATILHAEPHVQERFMRGMSGVALTADEEGPILFGSPRPAEIAKAV